MNVAFGVGAAVLVAPNPPFRSTSPLYNSVSPDEKSSPGVSAVKEEEPDRERKVRFSEQPFLVETSSNLVDPEFCQPQEEEEEEQDMAAVEVKTKTGVLRMARESFSGQSWEHATVQVTATAINFAFTAMDDEGSIPLSQVVAVEPEDIGDECCLTVTLHEGNATESLIYKFRAAEEVSNPMKVLSDWKIVLLCNMENMERSMLSPQKAWRNSRRAARQSLAVLRVQTFWRRRAAIMEAHRRRVARSNLRVKEGMLAAMSRVAAKCEAKQQASLTIQRVERGRRARSLLRREREKERCMIRISAKVTKAQAEALLPLVTQAHTATVKASVTRLWRDWGSRKVEIQGECCTHDAERISKALDKVGIRFTGAHDVCVFDKLRAALPRAGGGAWY